MIQASSPRPLSQPRERGRGEGHSKGIAPMTSTNDDTIQQWDIFELALNGSAEGNPFLDVELTAQFRYKHRTIEVDGFYDGAGVYRVRFMPDTPGTWQYRTRSNRDELG